MRPGAGTVLVVACAWVPLGGCAEGGRAGGGAMVRDSTGITIVENDPTRPRWTTPWTLSEEPLLRIGSPEGDDAQLLYRVTDSRRLRDGRILVVNSGAAEVRIYAADGELLRTLGRRGEGPGEFVAPWHAYPMRGDSILVVDLYREVAIFDSDGAYVREFNLLTEDGPLDREGASPVDQFGDGSLLFLGYGTYDPSWEGVRRSTVRMLRVPLDGTAATSLGEYEDQTSHYGNPYRDYAFGAWAKEAAAASTMWYGPGDRFELREITLDGTLLKLVRMHRPARPVTEADRERYRERYAEQMAVSNPRQGAAFWKQQAADLMFADSFPAHFEIETDPLGNVWVQDYRSILSDAPAERSWSVFDAEGVYLGDVIVPGGLAVHDIGEDHLVGRWTDDLGVEYVHVYGIEKPAG